MKEFKRIGNARIIQLDRYDSKGIGVLAVLEEDLPFPIKRIFNISEVQIGSSRGGHAHYYCHQILIASSGSFDVELWDGVNKLTYRLDNPFCALHIPPFLWASEVNFSFNAVCTVLCSHEYDEEDYIRNIEEYNKL